MVSYLTTGSTKALNCTNCKGEGTSCQDTGMSTRCDDDPTSVCGHLYYKINGSSKVESRCTHTKYCVGSLDCYQEDCDFAQGKVGYSDCVVWCCTTDNCEPVPPLKCNKCKTQGKYCRLMFVKIGCVVFNLQLDCILRTPACVAPQVINNLIM